LGSVSAATNSAAGPKVSPRDMSAWTASRLRWPERIQHVRVKARVWAALDRAIASAGVDCEALSDGVTIEVDDDTDYEPDAIVNCGPCASPDAIAATNPVIVVEVLSPATQSIDTSD
jgi:Uma2 family endonuclease